jgi:hypothetical protein
LIFGGAGGARFGSTRKFSADLLETTLSGSSAAKGVSQYTTTKTLKWPSKRQTACISQCKRCINQIYTYWQAQNPIEKISGMLGGRTRERH